MRYLRRHLGPVSTALVTTGPLKPKLAAKLQNLWATHGLIRVGDHAGTRQSCDARHHSDKQPSRTIVSRAGTESGVVLVGGWDATADESVSGLRGGRHAVARGNHHRPKSLLSVRVAVEAVAFGLALRSCGFDMANRSNEINAAFQPAMHCGPCPMTFL